MRQVRNATASIRAAIPKRSTVVPAGPMSGNSDLASEAPRVIESMAPIAAAMGAKAARDPEVKGNGSFDIKETGAR